MSSPVVFSLTAAQCRALRCLAEGKADETPERPLRQLVIKGLVSNSAGWALTPAGEAAALMVGRLSEASPIFRCFGADAEDAVSSPARGSLGLYARSYGESEEKSQENNGRRPGVLSRLAQKLLLKGDCVVEPASGSKLIHELSTRDWTLVRDYNAQDTVLRAAERSGKDGVLSVLRELRRRARQIAGQTDARH